MVFLVTAFSFFATAYSMQKSIRHSSYDLDRVIELLPKDGDDCTISIEKLTQSQIMAVNIAFYEQEPSIKGFANLCNGER